MDIDRIIAGTVSLIASIGLFKYERAVLGYYAELQKRHHHEDLSEDQIFMVKLFMRLFALFALIAGIILLYQSKIDS